MCFRARALIIIFAEYDHIPYALCTLNQHYFNVTLHSWCIATEHPDGPGVCTSKGHRR